MGTVKFPEGMDASTTIAGDDKLMIAKATTGEAMQATFDSAKQYLNITGIEVKAVTGGATEATAVVLAAGPAGQVRKMSGVTGWFKNATGSAWLAPTTNDNSNWWDGTTWSLGSSVPLPTSPLSNVINQDTDKGITPKGVDDGLKSQKDEIDEELSPLFDVFQSYNLYNKDADFHNNRNVSSVVNQGITTAAGWRIGVFRFQDAGRYTIQGWNGVRTEIAFFSGDVPAEPFPGSVTTGVVASGTATSVIGYGKVGGIISFDRPVGATWGAVTLANATEAESVYSEFQVVKGNNALPYLPYGEVKQIKASLFPSSLIKEIKVSAGVVLIRTLFNATLDLVRSISLNGSQNGASNMLSTKLIGATNDISFAGTVIHSMSDTVPAPLQVQVTTTTDPNYFNIGGNHGIKSVCDITSNGHGKTSSDLLSEWTDALGDGFYLTNIIDSNQIRVAAKPKAVGGVDKIKETPVSPLTHVSGAANTASISFTTTGAFEFKPSIKDINVQLFIDDVLIIKDGTYNGYVVKIIDTHTIADPTIPTLTNPYYPTNNGAMVKQSLIHTYYGNGSYTVEGIIDSQKNHPYTNYGVLQPEPMTKGSYTGHKMYIPNVGTISGYNLDSGMDLTVTTTGFTINTANLKDNTKVTNVMTQVLSDGTGPKIGLGSGINSTVGSGKSPGIARVYFPSFKKYYPRGFQGNSNTDVIRVVGFMSYFDASRNHKLSHDYFYYYGDKKFYCIMIGTAMQKEAVSLVDELRNKAFTVVEKSSGLTIHTQDYTSERGLLVTGAVGEWAVLRID